MDWIEAIVLGLVQGLTEFLPVSSDGHLAITLRVFDWLRQRPSSGAENLFFVVMLHVGTLAAILLFYRRVGFAAWRGLKGRDAGEPAALPAIDRATSLRAMGLAIAGTLPAVPVGLFLKPLIEDAFESPVAVGLGFLVTAAVLGLTLSLKSGSKGPMETSWLDALLVGVAQAFAPLPGVSRSGLTIAAALGLGFQRTWAVGFSLLLAIPAIVGATVLELKDLDLASVTGPFVAQTTAATVVAGVVGFLAIVWLVRIVSANRLWYFSVYLCALSAIVLFFAFRPLTGMARAEGRPGIAEVAADGQVSVDAPESSAPRVDGAAGGQSVEPGDRGSSGSGALDRVDEARP